MSSETSSEWFLYKVRRAHEALSVSARDSNVNTLSASFGTKWPYKRTISAPATMPPHPDTRHGKIQQNKGLSVCNIIVAEISYKLSYNYASCSWFDTLLLLTLNLTSFYSFYECCYACLFDVLINGTAKCLIIVVSSEREKVYSRQYSAPLLKRKTSKFGLGQLLAAPQPISNTQRSNNAHGTYCFLLKTSQLFYYIEHY